MPDEPKLEPATIADLLEKPPPIRTLVVQTPKGPRSVRLQGIDGDAFDALVAAHPPQPGDIDELGLPERWHAATFWPALIAASLAEPVLSVAEVQSFWSRWTEADRHQLRLAANAVNEGESDVQVGKASPVSAETRVSDD